MPKPAKRIALILAEAANHEVPTATINQLVNSNKHQADELDDLIIRGAVDVGVSATGVQVYRMTPEYAARILAP